MELKDLDTARPGRKIVRTTRDLGGSVGAEVDQATGDLRSSGNHRGRCRRSPSGSHHRVNRPAGAGARSQLADPGSLLPDSGPQGFCPAVTPFQAPAIAGSPPAAPIVCNGRILSRISPGAKPSRRPCGAAAITAVGAGLGVGDDLRRRPGSGAAEGSRSTGPLWSAAHPTRSPGSGRAGGRANRGRGVIGRSGYRARVRL